MYHKNDVSTPLHFINEKKNTLNNFKVNLELFTISKSFVYFSWLK